MRYRINCPSHHGEGPASHGGLVHHIATVKVGAGKPFQFTIGHDTALDFPPDVKVELAVEDYDGEMNRVGGASGERSLSFEADGKPHGRKGGLQAVPEPEPPAPPAVSEPARPPQPAAKPTSPPGGEIAFHREVIAKMAKPPAPPRRPAKDR